MQKILIIFAHPNLEKSLVQKALIQTAKEFSNVKVNDLYQEYPRFFIDIEREQSLLKEHDIIIFQYPLYWFLPPPMFVQWQDCVLKYNFAYGPEGDQLLGKKYMPVITIGAVDSAYSREGHNYYSVDEFLSPIKQCFSICKMELIKPFIIYNSTELRKNFLNVNEVPIDLKHSLDQYRKVLNDLSHTHTIKEKI